jgi:hypothetical protein
MSKNNKVNRDRYTQRGRLTPDDAAAELKKQRLKSSGKRRRPAPRAASARQLKTSER